MSKELVRKLRWRGDRGDATCIEAADRIEELERDLLNLICRIHRDGGHYIAKYGEAKAIADADTVAAQNNADLDALQADNARLREALKEIKRGLDQMFGDNVGMNGDGAYARCADFSRSIIKAALTKVMKPTCAAQSCNEV